jgi:hypothetical protein
MGALVDKALNPTIPLLAQSLRPMTFFGQLPVKNPDRPREAGESLPVPR